jgi:hypothetical protein
LYTYYDVIRVLLARSPNTMHVRMILLQYISWNHKIQYNKISYQYTANHCTELEETMIHILL